MPHQDRRSKDHQKHDASEQSNPFGLTFAGLLMPVPLTEVADLNTKLFAAVASISEEWTHFVAERLRKDFQLPRDLAACETPPEYLEVSRDFYNQAWRDYQRELARLAELGQSLTADAVDLMRTPATGSK
jgi:hypothetical protein